MATGKKLSDKTIDLVMLVINVIILGFPLVVAFLFFNIDVEEYIFKDYIFSSTLNKFALTLTINSLFILYKQHNLPPKCYGITKIKSFFRHIFIIVSWMSGAFLLCTDFILLIVSFLNIKISTVFNIEFILITTIINFILSIIVNFFSIFLIKKYNFNT